MKKILAILAMVTSAGAFAASATIEYGSLNGVQNTPQDQRNVNLTVRENINKNFIGDVQLSNTANVGNNGGPDTSSSFRVEGAVTGLYGMEYAKLYTRTAIGQKYTTANNFTFYSVEPGVIVPFGSTGLSAKVGFRFRNAFDSSTYADTTRTWRAGLAYEINDKNTIGVRYDNVRGDANQNAWNFNYTRGF